MYFKFSLQIDHGKYCRKVDKLPTNGRGHKHVIMVFGDLINKFGLGEAKHFKFRTEIEYTK